MSDCQHIHLIKEVGPMSEDGKTYKCQDCKAMLRVDIKPLEITVNYGRPK